MNEQAMTPHSYPVHTVAELAMMLAGQKPLAFFYRYADETFDELDGQDFDAHVRSGKMVKARFFVRNPQTGKNLIYSVFALKGEEWRIPLLKSLKQKMEQHGWSRDQEIIEGVLLGYSLEQNSEHLRLFFDAERSKK